MRKPSVMTECFEIWCGNSLIRRVSGIRSVLRLIFQNENEDFCLLKHLDIEIKLSGEPWKVREFCFGILGNTLKKFLTSFFHTNYFFQNSFLCWQTTRLIYLNVFALLIFILGWAAVPAASCHSKTLPLSLWLFEHSNKKNWVHKNGLSNSDCAKFYFSSFPKFQKRSSYATLYLLLVKHIEN